jgi:hypothetical protein
MKPTLVEKQRQNKGEKEWGKRKAIKKNRKRACKDPT